MDDRGYNPIEGNADTPGRPFAPLVGRWKSAISAAKAHRKTQFDEVADEARQFFDGERNHFWKDYEKQLVEQADKGFLAGGTLMPQFKFSINRMFDAVAMFGPALYHQNPTIAVTPRVPVSVSIDTYYSNDPQATEIVRMIPEMQAGVMVNPQLVEMAIMLQQQYEQGVQATQMMQMVNRDHAMILEACSNYYQNESSKRAHSRKAITEAIITGLGLLETTWITPAGGGPRVPRSRFLSNKDFLVDPDAVYWEDVTFIAIRRAAPKNIVEQRFGLPEGTLKGSIASNTALAGQNPKFAKNRHGDGKITKTCHDIVEYYDVFSKNGAGQRLKLGDQDKKIEGLDSLGDFVHLAICPQYHTPLNLAGIEMVDEMTGEVSQQALEAAAWPAPYWDDEATDGGWPVSRLIFHESPEKVWPISMCKPCLPEMRFINWCMSFMADGVAAGSKIYVAVQKAASKNIADQLSEGAGGPFTLLELEAIAGKSIEELISFLKAPGFNLDIYNMIDRVGQEIDKRLGLTELAYGIASRQMRSAAEAQYRQQNINIRPDDMAMQVENWLTVSAIREIQLLRWRGSFDDVEPIIGPLGAHVFDTQILTQDVSAITREFRFRVEAGSARKPNKDTRIAQLTDFGQYVLPVIQNAMSMGVTRPWNAYMQDLASAMEMDASAYLLTPQDEQQMMQFAMMQQAPAVPAKEGKE